jgi:hypothetical protein
MYSTMWPRASRAISQHASTLAEQASAALDALRE